MARFHALSGTVPSMNLVHGKTIESLGRLPRSHERDADGRKYWRQLEEVYGTWAPHPIDDESTGNPSPEGIKGKGAGSRVYSRMNIAFLSHRWSRPAEGLPDDEGNAKAEIVAIMTKYGREVYQLDTWWWVDWICANQDDAAGHIAALPLYIAASTEIFSAYIPGGASPSAQPLLALTI